MGIFSNFVPVVPAVLLLASIICLPLLADQMPGQEEQERRMARRRTSARVAPGATVPYVAMRRHDER